MTALSILDLVRVTQDTDARGAFDNARDLAAHAERWGYRRISAAAHPNMGGRAHPPSGFDPYRGGDNPHPRRRGRNHVAEPCPDHHRRAVRDPGAALSRPY